MYIFKYLENTIIGDYMNKEEYKRIVDNHKPTENRIGNSIIAFLVGGFVGVIAVFLTDFYSNTFDISNKDASTIMIVTLIFLACLFTSLGFFDKWVNFARCGLIIPITGFAHSLISAALEHKKEGLIFGIGSNMFKLAGSVIVYGISSAIVFGLIRYLLFGGA